MYYGLLENEGKRVKDEDAFSYACECIETGTEEEKKTFMEIAAGAKHFDEFVNDLVLWFYSGSWTHTWG